MDLSGLGKNKPGPTLVQVHMSDPIEVTAAFQSPQGWCFPNAEQSPEGCFLLLSPNTIDMIATRVIEKFDERMRQTHIPTLPEPETHD